MSAKGGWENIAIAILLGGVVLLHFGAAYSYRHNSHELGEFIVFAAPSVAGVFAGFGLYARITGKSKGGSDRLYYLTSVTFILIGIVTYIIKHPTGGEAGTPQANIPDVAGLATTIGMLTLWAAIFCGIYRTRGDYSPRAFAVRLASALMLLVVSGAECLAMFGATSSWIRGFLGLPLV